MSFRGLKVLVTGGTGSFGHKVASMISKHGPESVTIFSRDEKKQSDMRRIYPDFRYIVGDVRDQASVNSAVRGHNIIFHAAALKQVPSCEEFAEEAVKTNCLGIANVCRAAWESPTVDKVIALSTDKAVQPVNAMGISKAMGEKIVLSQPSGGPSCSVVRYGNVLGTRGSVIPLWKRQIKNKEPLTITGFEMTRFVMNLKDSFNLVDYAVTHAQGGEIFVWKAPAMTMRQLAQRVYAYYYEYFGPNYTGDAAYQEIGYRPGEKQHETLVCYDELYRSEDRDGYVVIRKEATPEAAQLKQVFTSDTATAPDNINAMLEEGDKDMEAY